VISIFNYIPRNKHAKRKAKANLKYIATRVNKEKQKVDRALFGHEGPKTKEQAKKMISQAFRQHAFLAAETFPGSQWGRRG
jgi:hypothetical protein